MVEIPALVATGRLTMPTTDVLINCSAVASKSVEPISQASGTEVAASSYPSRTAVLAGLGLQLWG